VAVLSIDVAEVVLVGFLATRLGFVAGRLAGRTDVSDDDTLETLDGWLGRGGDLFHVSAFEFFSATVTVGKIIFTIDPRWLGRFGLASELHAGGADFRFHAVVA
jgi:hypothetical protein